MFSDKRVADTEVKKGHYGTWRVAVNYYLWNQRADRRTKLGAETIIFKCPPGLKKKKKKEVKLWAYVLEILY